MAIIPLIGSDTRYLPEMMVCGRFTLERVGIRGWKWLPNFYLFLPIPPLNLTIPPHIPILPIVIPDSYTVILS